MNKKDEAVVEKPSGQQGLNRRSALMAVGSAAGALLLGAGPAAARGKKYCTEAPAVTEGPYWEDDSASGYKRSDIRSDIDGSNTQDGVVLTLKLYIYQYAATCTPLSGAQVDIWHCNANGEYSAVSGSNTNPDTSAHSWLRGYQISDSNGLVTFKTIFPGWYVGRTTHIHLRVRSGYDNSADGSSNTTQLFFRQALIDKISTTVSPYSSKGKNSITNDQDNIYGSTDGDTVLTAVGTPTAGYTATLTLGVPLVAA